MLSTIVALTTCSRRRSACGRPCSRMSSARDAEHRRDPVALEAIWATWHEGVTAVYRSPRPLPANPGVVRVKPFFAKIIARSLAGSVWLAFLETSCVAPGCS